MERLPYVRTNNLPSYFSSSCCSILEMHSRRGLLCPCVRIRDKPGHALACYLAVVGTFTGAYWAITTQVFGFVQSRTSHLLWYEVLVLSVSSFHGRGLFPSTLTLGDPIALVAAGEAVIGLFIEPVFIATFTQRFFAR